MASYTVTKRAAITSLAVGNTYWLATLEASQAITEADATALTATLRDDQGATVKTLTLDLKSNGTTIVVLLKYLAGDNSLSGTYNLFFAGAQAVDGSSAAVTIALQEALSFTASTIAATGTGAVAAVRTATTLSAGDYVAHYIDALSTRDILTVTTASSTASGPFELHAIEPDSDNQVDFLEVVAVDAAAGVFTVRVKAGITTAPFASVNLLMIDGQFQSAALALNIASLATPGITLANGDGIERAGRLFFDADGSSFTAYSLTKADNNAQTEGVLSGYGTFFEVAQTGRVHTIQATTASRSVITGQDTSVGSVEIAAADINNDNLIFTEHGIAFPLKQLVDISASRYFNFGAYRDLAILASASGFILGADGQYAGASLPNTSGEIMRSVLGADDSIVVKVTGGLGDISPSANLGDAFNSAKSGTRARLTGSLNFSGDTISNDISTIVCEASTAPAQGDTVTLPKVQAQRASTLVAAVRLPARSANTVGFNLAAADGTLINTALITLASADEAWLLASYDYSTTTWALANSAVKVSDGTAIAVTGGSAIAGLPGAADLAVAAFAAPTLSTQADGRTFTFTFASAEMLAISGAANAILITLGDSHATSASQTYTLTVFSDLLTNFSTRGVGVKTSSVADGAAMLSLFTGTNAVDVQGGKGVKAIVAGTYNSVALTSSQASIDHDASTEVAGEYRIMEGLVYEDQLGNRIAIPDVEFLFYDDVSFGAYTTTDVLRTNESNEFVLPPTAPIMVRVEGGIANFFKLDTQSPSRTIKGAVAVSPGQLDSNGPFTLASNEAGYQIQDVSPTGLHIEVSDVSGTSGNSGLTNVRGIRFSLTNVLESKLGFPVTVTADFNTTLTVDKAYFGTATQDSQLFFVGGAGSNTIARSGTSASQFFRMEIVVTSEFVTTYTGKVIVNEPSLAHGVPTGEVEEYLTPDTYYDPGSNPQPSWQAADYSANTTPTQWSTYDQSFLDQNSANALTFAGAAAVDANTPELIEIILRSSTGVALAITEDQANPNNRTLNPYASGPAENAPTVLKLTYTSANNYWTVEDVSSPYTELTLADASKPFVFFLNKELNIRASENVKIYVYNQVFATAQEAADVGVDDYANAVNHADFILDTQQIQSFSQRSNVNPDTNGVRLIPAGSSAELSAEVRTTYQVQNTQYGDYFALVLHEATGASLKIVLKVSAQTAHPTWSLATPASESVALGTRVFVNRDDLVNSDADYALQYNVEKKQATQEAADTTGSRIFWKPEALTVATEFPAKVYVLAGRYGQFDAVDADTLENAKDPSFDGSVESRSAQGHHCFAVGVTLEQATTQAYALGLTGFTYIDTTAVAASYRQTAWTMGSFDDQTAAQLTAAVSVDGAVRQTTGVTTYLQAEAPEGDWATVAGTDNFVLTPDAVPEVSHTRAGTAVQVGAALTTAMTSVDKLAAASRISGDDTGAYYTLVLDVNNTLTGRKRLYQALKVNFVGELRGFAVSVLNTDSFYGFMNMQIGSITTIDGDDLLDSFDYKLYMNTSFMSAGSVVTLAREGTAVTSAFLRDNVLAGLAETANPVLGWAASSNQVFYRLELRSARSERLATDYVAVNFSTRASAPSAGEFRNYTAATNDVFRTAITLDGVKLVTSKARAFRFGDDTVPIAGSAAESIKHFAPLTTLSQP